MKRTTQVIFIFLLLVFIPSFSSAEPKLKYDFQYLFKWTASKMGITIDPNKSQPKLVILPKEEIRRLYEEKTGKKLITEKNGIKITLIIAGFWRISENKIYVKDEADIAEGGILEEIIVHEIVHYFQDFYFPAYGDLTCLKEPYPQWNCPWEREAYAIEKKFRLDHGLFIKDKDLKHLMFYLDNFK